MLPEHHMLLTDHALFKSLAKVGVNRSYLEPNLFARIVLAMHNADQLGAKEREAVAPLLVGAMDDRDRMNAVEEWFRAAMDHATGAYKRWSQVWLLAVGLVVSFSCNFDVFQLTSAIYKSDSLRGEFVKAALVEAKKPAPSEAAVRSVMDAATPLGTVPTCSNIPGILLGAIGISWGATFWFDLLRKLVNLRGSG